MFRASAQLWEERVGRKEGGVNNIPRPEEWKDRKADGAHDSSSAGYSAGRDRVGPWTILGARKEWIAKDGHMGSW